MNVLSLFDGLSGAQLALNRAGIKYDKYYASEIDKYATAVTQYRFPDTIQLGDVTKIKAEDLPEIDLLIGGSPCQGFSFSGKHLNFNDPRSKLFFEFTMLLKEIKPKYFLLENVRMKKEYMEVISKNIGVEPIMINSALLSAQNRKRLYWTNIEGINQPEDKGILLKDVLEPLSEVDERMVMNGKAFTLTATYHKATGQASIKNSIERKQRTMVRDKSGCIQATYWKENLKSMDKRGKTNLFVGQKPIRVGNIDSNCQGNSVYSEEGKSVTLSANSGGLGSKTGLYAVAQRGRYKEDGSTEQKIETSYEEKASNVTTVQKDSLVLDTENYIIRKLTPRECERLQTVPDDYTLVPHPVYKNKMMSNTQRYKMLGNGFTIDVIAHILKSIK